MYNVMHHACTSYLEFGTSFIYGIKLKQLIIPYSLLLSMTMLPEPHTYM